MCSKLCSDLISIQYTEMVYLAEYNVWNVLREKVYRSKIADVDELKTRLIDEWAHFWQSIVDATVSY